jgi:DNA-entry nuclease
MRKLKRTLALFLSLCVLGGGAYGYNTSDTLKNTVQNFKEKLTSTSKVVDDTLSTTEDSKGLKEDLQNKVTSITDKIKGDTEESTEAVNNGVTLGSTGSVLDVEVPEYTGQAYITVNNNTPFFTEEEKTSTEPFETYSELDSLGRCGVAYANICPALMPTEKRGEIGQIKPTGWHTVKYPDVISDLYYNRCHLIGYQLAGENANEKNLITGTRYLNIDGMLDTENAVAEYVKSTGNHALYRVTPVFTGDNLVCNGLFIEAYSVEDSGAGITLCIYCYNVQPGITIDYATGDSWVTE